MTRVPALPSQNDAAEAQVDAAVHQLVDLFARQFARTQAADAHETKEPSNAEHDQKD